MKLRSTVQLVANTGAALYLYNRFGRRWVRDWGARPDEVAMTLPGDDILPHASLQTTRAITVDTSPEHVWPWIVQMGGGKRAGAYTYDWIERLLGIDIKNSDSIRPEFQHLEPGEYLMLNQGTGIVVRAVEPDHALVVQWVPAGSTWAFALLPEGDGQTRLVSRNRLEGKGPGFWLMAAIMEPLSLVMERKMLLGIKQRAEQHHRETIPPVRAGHEELTWLERGTD